MALSRGAGLDPTFRFETSWTLTPAVLFALRALFALYAFVTQFFIFGWNGAHSRDVDSRHSFSYFTILTYWGLAFYFAISAAHTASYWRTGVPFLAKWPRVLQIAHSMFYSTIVVYPFIVTAVFWALLAPAGGFPTVEALWSNTSQHALNSAYALFEILIPRTEPLPFLHLIVIVLVLALYLALAYLTHATEGWYTYDFLDLDKHSSGVVAGYIVGILVGSIIVFLIVRYVIVLRLWLTEKKMGKVGKFSSRGQPRVAEEEWGGHIKMDTVNAK